MVLQIQIAIGEIKWSNLLETILIEIVCCTGAAADCFWPCFDSQMKAFTVNPLALEERVGDVLACNK